jgi:hypothetical protein
MTKRITSIALFLCLACISVFAQTTTTPAPAVTGLPQYVFGSGETFSPYSSAPTLLGKSSTIGTFGVRVASSNVYSWTSMQLVPGVTSGAIVTTGAAYVAFQSGKFSLLAIGQAGLSVGSTVTLGTFSGGGLLTYQLGAAANNTFLTFGMTVTGISGNTVQPSFGVGIARGF